MGSTFFEDLSKITEDREPQIEEKYSAYAGKLYRVQGMKVWTSTKEAAREAYKNAQS